MHLVFAACGVILAVLLVVGSDEVIKLHRIRIADYVGRGGFLAGVIGVLLKLFSVPLQNMVRLPESLTLWMLVILILSSTTIIMLSKIHEVLLEIRDK